MPFILRFALLSSLLCAAGSAATLFVGPTGTYRAPCAAIAVAHDGDTIQIDSTGNYSGDVCGIRANSLTLIGSGNDRAKIPAAGHNYKGKATWVISGNNTTVENIEFSGATCPSHNGAGIRQEGQNLTVINCYFHDNQEGILAASNPASKILIQYSEFANNGFGDGRTHNLYINQAASFTLEYCYSHDAKVGHLVKSRAAKNFILYNRLSGEGGTDSYELDLPNGGVSYVIGNLIEQGPNTQNATMVTFGEEGAVPGSALFLVNNTIVNYLPGEAFYLNVDSSVQNPAKVTNNILWGNSKTTYRGPVIVSHNLLNVDPKLVNQGAYDYHLLASSPAINTGILPGDGLGFPLLPVFQHVHPACQQSRSLVSVIDIGAYEYGSGSSKNVDGDGCLNFPRGAGK